MCAINNVIGELMETETSQPGMDENIHNQQSQPVDTPTEAIEFVYDNVPNFRVSEHD
jgi:hypothetical protein